MSWAEKTRAVRHVSPLPPDWSLSPATVLKMEMILQLQALCGQQDSCPRPRKPSGKASLHPQSSGSTRTYQSPAFFPCLQLTFTLLISTQSQAQREHAGNTIAQEFTPGSASHSIQILRGPIFQASEMCQWVRCLLCKRENLSVDPQHPCKKGGYGSASL